MQNPKASPIKQSDDNSFCRPLLLIAYATLFLIVLLNLYIAYNILVYFMGDGFSFMGGLFIGTSFIVTIPINILFIYQPKKVKELNKTPIILFIILGIITLLFGIIVHNITPFWPFISAFGLLQFIAAILCQKHKKKRQKLA